MAPIDVRFPAAVEYWSYHLLNKLSGHDDDALHELQKVAKNIEVQMKDHPFSVKDKMPVICFLHEFKLAWYTYRIHEGTAMCLFKQFLTGPVEEVMK